MRAITITTRHFCLWLGPDYFRKRPLHLIIGAIHRANSPVGEWKFRVMLNLHFSPSPHLDLGFLPAWQDVPSVATEYERTMR